MIAHNIEYINTGKIKIKKVEEIKDLNEQKLGGPDEISKWILSVRRNDVNTCKYFRTIEQGKLSDIWKANTVPLYRKR